MRVDFNDFMKTRKDVALAYVNGDPEPLHEILPHRSPSTFFGPRGGHVKGAAAVWKADREGAEHFRPGSGSRLEVLHAADSGDLAYWVGIQHANVHVKDKPQPVAMDLRVTEIFQRDGDSWKLIHRHADMLTEPQKPPGH